MDALDSFLRGVLPPTGNYCLFHKFDGYPKHEWFGDIESLCQAIESYQDQEDLYFGTSTYAEPTERTQTNVQALKALRIDIDAGEKKFAKDPSGCYETRRHALQALVDCIRNGLPDPSFLLSSGEGLHAYWELTESLTPEQWAPAARTLSAACKSLGLKVDVKVTKDTARVLRPIGTLHNNGTRVGSKVYRASGLVYDTQQIKQTLSKLLDDEAAFDLAAESTTLKRNFNDDILQYKGPSASIAKVAEHCAAIAKVRDTKGDVPEPVWRSFLGVAKYCEDGEAHIHPWSEGDPRYSWGQTQAKFDRWETPPATCESFQPYGFCDGCKYAGKVTTPKQLGYIEVEPQLEAPPKVKSTLELPDETPPAQPEPEQQSTATFDIDAYADPEPESEDEYGQAPNLAQVSAPNCPVPGREYLFDPTQPFYYAKRDGNWTLFATKQKKKKDATGVEATHEFVTPVFHKLVWVDYVTNVGASETNGQLTMLGRIDRVDLTEPVIFPMPSECTVEPATTGKFLQNQGIILNPNNPDAAKDAMRFLKDEQIKGQNHMRFVLKSRFGYHIHEGRLVCSQGVYTVYPRSEERGEIQRTVINPSLNAVASALGTSCLPDSQQGCWDGSVWKSHVGPSATQYITFLRKHYGHEGYEVPRLALSVCLASPFLVFCADTPITTDPELPAVGLVVSLFSQESGKGKSALQDSVALGYGTHSLRRAGKREAMTETAAKELAYATSIYPFLLDEVTRNGSEDAAQMIDTYANGQGRIRSNNAGVVKHANKSWSLVTCVSTNVPQRELLASAQKNSDALSLRLLELDFDRLPQCGDHLAFRADYKALSGHCGAFGLLLAYMTVNKGLAGMNAIAQQCMEEAYEYLQCGQHFRFFVRGLAAVLIMHRLLGRHAPFDIEEIMATYKQAVENASWESSRDSDDTQQQFIKMLSDLSPNIAVTNSWTAKGGNDLLHNPNVRLPLAGREVQDRGVVVLDAGAIRKWCTDNQISYRNFLKRNLELGVLVSVDGRSSKTRLTTGLRNLPTQSVWGYTFRLRPAPEGSDASAISDESPDGQE